MSIPRVPVRKANTGSYYVEYHCSGYRRRPGIGTDKGEAQKIAFEIRHYLAKGLGPKIEMAKEGNKKQSQGLKLKEFWIAFKKEHLPTLRPKTRRLYQYLMTTISQYPIARLPLVEINRRAVMQYQRQRKGKASPATINREVQLIKSMPGKAYEWEILDRDPRPGMKLLKEQNRRDVSNIKPEQIIALLESLPNALPDISGIALYAGFLRKETILSMKIEQVRLPDIGNRGTVRFEAKGGGFTLKQIGPQAIEILRKATGERTEGYVFLSPKGGRYITIHKTLDRHIRKLGIVIMDGRKFCFHDFRRLYATWMLNAGRSLDEVREALDHKDRATTGRYATMMGGDVFEPVLEGMRK